MSIFITSKFLNKSFITNGMQGFHFIWNPGITWNLTIQAKKTCKNMEFRKLEKKPGKTQNF